MISEPRVAADGNVEQVREILERRWKLKAWYITNALSEVTCGNCR